MVMLSDWLVPVAAMRNRNLHRILCLANCAAFAFTVFSAEAADSGIIAFQERSDTPSENASPPVGHWRKTTIEFETPKDEHLVLHADGTAENWVVRTAAANPSRAAGKWRPRR
jgi:hypothetical protein